MSADRSRRPSPGRVALSLLLWAVAAAVTFVAVVYAIGVIFASSIIKG